MSHSRAEQPIKIMFVEDDPDFSYLIRRQLACEKDFDIVGSAVSREEAVKMAQALQPHIVLMDLNLSPTQPLGGIEASREIKLVSHAKVILLTGMEDAQISIEASKKAFASGYIFKSQYEFIPETIRKTALGHTPQEDFIKALIFSDLSAAEKTVLDMILGKNIKLLSSDKTIANQKTKIFKKLGVKQSSELIRLIGEGPYTGVL